MSRSKPNARLPRAVTERRSFFAHRFDDVVITGDQVVVLPAVVMSVTDKRCVEYLLGCVPQASQITFLLRGLPHRGAEEGAFMDVLMAFWPECDSLGPELAAVGNEMLREFIALLKAKAPGAIAEAFGGLFP